MLSRVATSLVCVSALALVTSCSSTEESKPPRVLRVPSDFTSIQKAVDAASSGDLVLIAPGTYHESIDITADDIAVRGENRNSVIIDGEYERDNGIRVAGADGVAIENLTVKNFRFNGVFWTGSNGYRASYVTAIRNGDYGIYAYSSVNGLFERSYASGSPDAGFYIGQCKPCHAVVSEVISEFNGFGFSGTNASNDIFIVNSTFSENRAGIVPNSGDGEQLAPQGHMTIAGNRVYDNNNPDTPAISSALRSMGIGILVAGGSNNVIEKNWISNHDIVGIAIVSNTEQNTYIASSNRVVDNVVIDSRVADIAVGTGDIKDNCFAGNEISTSLPRRLQDTASCSHPVVNIAPTDAFDFAKFSERNVPPAADRRLIPDPAPQPSMINPITTPASSVARKSPTLSISLANISRPSSR